MRRFGRPALIGIVLALLMWLTLVVVLGIRLTELEPAGHVEIGVGPVKLASGTVAGSKRDAGLDLGGYLLAAFLILTPLVISFARSRSELDHGSATRETPADSNA